MSRNHFNLEWVGERRLKNAVMVLEWVPSVSQLAPLPTRNDSMSDAQKARLQSALRLLDLDCSGSFDRAELREVLRSAEDLQLSEAELDDLLAEHGEELSYDVLHDVLTSGRYRRTDKGRYFVLLSLAEAETVKAISWSSVKPSSA
jgi:hypothetical protein